MSEAKKYWYPYVGFDISIPVGQLGGFVETCRARLAIRFPDIEQVYFGHVADSNLHVMVHLPARGAGFPKREIETEVYQLVREHQGCISAEHGIGMSKMPFLNFSRSAEEIGLMQTIKQALDPKGILNAGKVLPGPVFERSVSTDHNHKAQT